MLSPRTSIAGSPPTNFSPITKACASPLGSGCSAYSIRTPHSEPSPRRRRNIGRSCGVEMISVSRIPASMTPFICGESCSSLSQSPGLGDHAETLARVDLFPQRAPPPLVVEIPAHRLLDAALERFARAPAKLALELGGVDRIAEIVPGPVGDKGNEGVVRAWPRPKFIEDGANAPHHIDVTPFIAAADVVFLADPPAGHGDIERPRVVLDIEPVAHVGSRAIDRQRLAVDGVENDQRNELLGKMIGAVIVRA